MARLPPTERHRTVLMHLEEQPSRKSPDFEGDPLRRAAETMGERLLTDHRAETGREKALSFPAYQHRVAVARKPSPPWTELGPRPLAQRLGVDTEVSGRAKGVAFSRSDPDCIYLAAANGGVWRSHDGGVNWAFTMEAFDLDPRLPGADSLSCGAIAVAPQDPNRVYVGTGEATSGRFLGVGPLVSHVGGVPTGGQVVVWQVEAVDSSSPPLEGQGFYQLAVSPDDADLVVGATTVGLYWRAVDAGSASWHRVLTGSFTSVVAGKRRDGTVVFLAAAEGGGVFAAEASRLAAPDAWKELGKGFPTDNLGRICLAIAGDEAETVFALAAMASGGLHGVYRLRLADGNWRRLAGAPQDIFTGYGAWAQAIAVDPGDPNLFYLGGSTVEIDRLYLGALYRCQLGLDGETMSFTFIGYGVHADIQALAFTPGPAKHLWAACDGGVFVAEDPAAAGQVFESRNGTLGTITLNHLAQHPTGDELYCGSQDNGLVRYHGNHHQRWETIFPGDCSHAVMHWADPNSVLAAVFDGRFGLHREGRPTDFNISLPLERDEAILFNAPLAGTPPPPSLTPELLHQADRVAAGSIRPWISERFGEDGSWVSIPTLTLEGDRLDSVIYSLRFASYLVLYAGTEFGGVYRFDFDPQRTSWSMKVLAAPRAPVYFRAPVTDIAVDPADPSGASIYVTLGGSLEVAGRPDYRRLWHYDGATGNWQPRSGPQQDPDYRLLPVKHNAVAVDPQQPQRLWVGADIGVWVSEDGGARWEPCQTALPDASVIDLDFHPTLRLLRASTHGRGCFELKVPP